MSVSKYGDSLSVGTYGAKGDRRKGGITSKTALETLRRSYKGGDVVFDVGTNDPSADALRRSIRRARKTVKGRIIMATVNGPGARGKNRVLKAAAARGDITLVKWKGRGGLASDSIHATPQGYKKRKRLFDRAIQSEAPRKKTPPKGTTQGSARVPSSDHPYLPTPPPRQQPNTRKYRKSLRIER